MLEFLGARVERIPVIRRDDVASLDLDRIEQLLPEGPRLLLFSHPSNPTGAVYSPEVVARLAELATRGGFRVLVDELYARLVYDDAPFTHLVTQPGMADLCITLVGPSKTESLSGFRIGLVVGPEDVIEATEQVLAITSLRAPAYAQRLLPHWLVDDADFVAQRIVDLQALRTMTLQALQAVPGLTVAEPQGTAYAFPNVTALGVPDIQVAKALQQEAGVIVSPGYQFGPSAMGHFRICYARDETEWARALDRIVATLGKLAL
jgi:aspartate/methionine/tyrosine aminotransferase